MGFMVFMGFLIILLYYALESFYLQVFEGYF